MRRKVIHDSESQMMKSTCQHTKAKRWNIMTEWKTMRWLFNLIRVRKRNAFKRRGDVVVMSCSQVRFTFRKSLVHFSIFSFGYELDNRWVNVNVTERWLLRKADVRLGKGSLNIGKEYFFLYFLFPMCLTVRDYEREKLKMGESIIWFPYTLHGVLPSPITHKLKHM